jgi:hypothetical protein
MYTSIFKKGIMCPYSFYFFFSDTRDKIYVDNIQRTADLFHQYQALPTTAPGNLPSYIYALKMLTHPSPFI